MRFNYARLLATVLVSAMAAGTVHAQVSDQQDSDVQTEDQQMAGLDAEVFDIEALVDNSATPESAINTARSQVGEGDVSGAATTLERALIADPNSTEARAYYIALMCLLDDQMAAEYELKKLAGTAIADADWNDVEKACGPMTRPVAAQ
ncbi:hypothetical protein [Parasphingorhabdus sp.]|uniref:hypothetical protein n=1 Tax=Parasphingorhabdus sp. TaxID=2709688 RepID=UPI0030035974